MSGGYVLPWFDCGETWRVIGGQFGRAHNGPACLTCEADDYADHDSCAASGPEIDGGVW